MKERKLYSEFKEKLNEKLIELFSKEIHNRAEYWNSTNLLKPRKEDVPEIIRSFANKNAAVAYGLNLLPGPAGMVAVIPEMTIILRNQIHMVYDISLAYNEKEYFNKEVLLAIFLSAFGLGALGVAVIKGGRVLLRKLSIKIMQRMTSALAEKISQQVLKRIMGKWFPFIGAAVIAAWTRYSTVRIGKKSIEFFEKEIVLIENE